MAEQQETEPPNPLMRKKKTPEELAREAEAEDEDDFTSKLIKGGRLHSRQDSNGWLDKIQVVD